MMNPLLLRSLFLLLLLVSFSAANPAVFQEAREGRTFQFPRDHGTHPEFKQEWWYYAGHLQSQDGDVFGYQLTFFRLALGPSDHRRGNAGAVQNIFSAHMALTIPTKRAFISQNKVAPEILGLVDAATNRLKVRVDDWHIETKGTEHYLRARSKDLSLDLRLTPLRPPILHGKAGYVLKDSPAGSSHHYSITRLATRGTVELDKRSFTVEGTSWFDREFCTTLLGPQQRGWDWFALQLTDGTDVMLYLIRTQDGSLDPHSYGAIIDPQGRVHRLNSSDFQISSTARWKSPRSGAVYPAGWRLTIPGRDAELTLTPTVADQEVCLAGLAALTYWEGQVTVRGQQGRSGLTGQGYVELTGYVKPVHTFLAEQETGAMPGPQGPPSPVLRKKANPP